MRKRVISILLPIFMLLALLPTYVSAAAIPTSWKAPGSLVVSETEYQTSIFFSVDSALLKFIDEEQTDHEALGIDSVGHTAQVDWKLNNGNWHYTADWDKISGEYKDYVYAQTGYLSGEVTEERMIFDLRNAQVKSALGSAMIKGGTDEENRLDLKNNTFYFRVRVLADYNTTDSGKDVYILSPWSETVAYGKEAVVVSKPTMLEKPTISNPVVGKNPDGSPNITFTAITPKQVLDANAYTNAHEANLGTGASIAADHQININNTGWVDATAGVWWLAGETRTINVPTSYDNGKTMKIDEAYIQIRMRYTFGGGATVGPLQSEWSNIVSVNTPSWSSASEWATNELQAASQAGLIPDILKGADMTRPITREEFAELAVLLHEKVSGKASTPVSPNPFTDTTNKQILKAFNLKITAGTSATTFSPNTLINREQCAAMLFRTINGLKPNGDYSIDGIKDFPDQAFISDWAVNATKYMFKIGIIKGDESGHFMPKATTSVQEAEGYGMATREASILMTVRTYNKLK